MLPMSIQSEYIVNDYCGWHDANSAREAGYRKRAFAIRATLAQLAQLNREQHQTSRDLT